MPSSRPERRSDLRAEVEVLELQVAIAEAEADDYDELAALVEIAELEVAIAERALDAEVLPTVATRALFDHERRARTHFAGIEQEREAIAQAIGRRLTDDRTTMLGLIEADLARKPTQAAITRRLLAIDGPAGLSSVRGARELMASTKAWVLERLIEAHELGALRLIDEAIAQGVKPPAKVPKVTRDDRMALSLQAERIAQAPHVDLIRALRERAVATP